MRFPPIAIVGRGCVLPGALSPGALWELVTSPGACALTHQPADRWGVPVDAIVPRHAPHDVFGYVAGFDDAFDSRGCGPETLADTAARWTLHAARQALTEAGVDAIPSAAVSGLALGWLALPDSAMAAEIEEAWHAGRSIDAHLRRRRVSPAGICARELGFGAGSLALDAACASSLYALKLACDQLHDGTADLMLAGGVSAADPLLLQIGFTALSALSPSARYRPLHQDADGLVPAEGAAVVALMRLPDALARGIRVLGVIRGIGLSNDGRTEGLLVPSEDGQIRAMRQAYEMAGVQPASVGLLECHATGTARGDATEIRSSAQIFADAADLTIGAAKANIGHTMTASGTVGILKILGAIEHGVRPLTAGPDDPIDVLCGSPLRILCENEPWDGPRRAAVSAFGFGGNNAHVIIDGPELASAELSVQVPEARTRASDVAVVAVRVGDVSGDRVEVGLDGLHVPPADLKAALARHVRILETAREAVREVALPADRTNVIIAADCDAEIVRYTERLRSQDPAAPTSEQVVGFLANMTSNRISSQLGLTGPSFAIGADDASNADVVALAARAIGNGEADAAILGSVDDESAVVAVLKRLDHASRDGDPIMTVLPSQGSSLADLVSLVSYQPPRWHVFSGPDRACVLAALGSGQESWEGPARLVIVAADGQLPQRLAQARRWLLGQAPKPRWAAYRDRPLPGRIAAVYPGGAAAYVGMGRQLGAAFPGLVADLVHQCPQIFDIAGWVFEGKQRPGDTISCVWGAAYFAHLHTAIVRDVLGVELSAALGYSSGESTALTALGAWRDLDSLVSDLRSSPLFTRDLAGPYEAVQRFWRREGVSGTAWQTFLATRSAEVVADAARDEPAVYLMAVNSPNSCTFGGDPAACARVSQRLGTEHVIPLDYDLAIHAPVVTEVRDQWHDLHCRATNPVPGISFYGSAMAAAYDLDAENAAAANTAQAIGTVDFRGTVEQAWADGVRIFIELGPAGGCTEWISQTLGDREHLAVSLDASGASDVDNLAHAVAALIAAGVDVDDARLAERLGKRRAGAIGRKLLIDVRPVLPTESGAEEPARIPTARTPAAVDPLVLHHELVAARHIDFIRLLNTGHDAFLAQRERINTLLLDVAKLPAQRPAHQLVLFDRADLEYLAVGAVSKLFGPAFVVQDGFPRQTRMPGPPMLLADRVLWIDAEPATMGTGSIRTQTDVRADSWYLDPSGRMPAGLMVEAGQADLLLISWLGADLHNQGERVYRLLGCEITYHASPPHPGETLTFDISIDDHAEHNGVRLFSFRYECSVAGVPRLSVRGGQAGFFTDAELSDTRGVLWAPPPVPPEPMRRFDREQVRAFAEGRFIGWHVRTPRPAGPELLLFDEVDAFDPDAGYLRATLSISPASWFFEGHFVGDPCMPGTLMLEGCFQLLAFHLTACGATMPHDGWRFEPVPGHTSRISCRAQVIPESRTLTYELFIKEARISDPRPTLIADVLCTVDGVRAFLAEDLAIQLVPDWPLDQWRWLGGLADHVEPKPAVFGLESLLACAWGRPSEMMGSALAPMDDGRRVARLPGPPYHFMSRITELGEHTIVAEYDVPGADAWFWREGNGRTMPLCVLLEVALQPCGWLALYTGEIPAADVELLFRNLDGRGTIGNVELGTRILRTEVRLLEISRTGAMIIDAFALRVWADDRLVADLHSDFGFFPPSAFADQPGLPGPGWRDDTQYSNLDQGLIKLPLKTLLRRTGPMLSLIDRITGFWPEQGRIRAEKDIAPDDWYFRAHFFQDPVQPGSLGIEAMLQLIQSFMVYAGHAAPDAVFEPWLDGRTTTWKYRGQVVPQDPVTVIEVEVTESGPGYAVADAWLSVGDRTIYHAGGLGVRVWQAPDETTLEVAGFEETLDPAAEPWLHDHRPTWTVPALPMMSVVDRLAAASGRPVAGLGLRDVRLSRWIVVDRPVHLSGRCVDDMNVDNPNAGDARVDLVHDGEVVASASVSASGDPSRHLTPAPLTDPTPTELPYARGAVFHGPAFHYLTRLTLGTNGASGTLDAAHGGVPRGRLHQGLLDATLHAIPHDELWRWSDRIRPGHVGYPYRLPWLDFFDELPSVGLLDVEARFTGFDADIDVLPTFDVQVRESGSRRLILAYRLVEVLVPLGPLAGLDAVARAAFLRDRQYVAGAGMSEYEGGETRVRAESVEALEWFPGTVAHLYRLPADLAAADCLAQVAIRDHVARRAAVHPSLVLPSADLRSATIVGHPVAEIHRVAVERMEREARVRDADATSGASSR